MGTDHTIEASPGVITPYLRLDEVLVNHAHALHSALGANFVGLYPIQTRTTGRSTS